MRRTDIIGASELSQAEKCGLAHALHIQYPEESGPAAKLGTAFHAMRSGSSSWSDGLTAAEIKLCMTWNEQVSERFGQLISVKSGELVKEYSVGLDANGNYCDYNSLDAVTGGTVDAAWESGDLCTVIDYKTGERYPEGWELQLAVYGLALAHKWKCHIMRLGIYLCREDRWIWTEDIPLDSEQAGTLYGRIMDAAKAQPVAKIGSHCGECWQRQHCPARLLPAYSGVTALVPFIEANGLCLTNLGQAYQLVGAMSDIVDRAKEQIRAFVYQQGGSVPLGDGKELVLTEVQGRESADLAAIKEAGLTQYIKRGSPYQTLKIRKVKA